MYEYRCRFVFEKVNHDDDDMKKYNNNKREGKEQQNKTKLICVNCKRMSITNTKVQRWYEDARGRWWNICRDRVCHVPCLAGPKVHNGGTIQKRGMLKVLSTYFIHSSLMNEWLEDDQCSGVAFNWQLAWRVEGSKCVWPQT